MPKKYLPSFRPRRPIGQRLPMNLLNWVSEHSCQIKYIREDAPSTTPPAPKPIEFICQYKWLRLAKHHYRLPWVLLQLSPPLRFESPGMETRNTKLEIYRKAIAKHYMPPLPISFRRSGPRRPLITQPARLVSVEICPLTHISSRFLKFMASRVYHSGLSSRSQLCVED